MHCLIISSLCEHYHCQAYYTTVFGCCYRNCILHLFFIIIVTTECAEKKLNQPYSIPIGASTLLTKTLNLNLFVEKSPEVLFCHVYTDHSSVENKVIIDMTLLIANVIMASQCWQIIIIAAEYTEQSGEDTQK